MGPDRPEYSVTGTSPTRVLLACNGKSIWLKFGSMNSGLFIAILLAITTTVLADQATNVPSLVIGLIIVVTYIVLTIGAIIYWFKNIRPLEKAGENEQLNYMTISS